MLNRQKALIALISEAGHVPGRIQLFKYSFLLKTEGDLPNDFVFYDFVPYKFGPYSFSLERELFSLRTWSYVEDLGQGFRIRPSMQDEVMRILSELDEGVRATVRTILIKYGSLKRRELIRAVYEKYPTYASNSFLRDLLPPNSRKPARAALAVYTLGYEGCSIDRFLNRIIGCGLSTILDVRANPVSRKYGFAKSSMSRLAAKLGVTYAHIPDLGISSGERKGISTREAYENLFAKYEVTTLLHNQAALKQASDLVTSRPTVLICREDNHESCHRSRLANALRDSTGLSIVHLYA